MFFVTSHLHKQICIKVTIWSYFKWLFLMNPWSHQEVWLASSGRQCRVDKKMSQLGPCGLPCDLFRRAWRSNILSIQRPSSCCKYFNQMPPFYDLHCAIPTEAFFLISTGIDSSITLVSLTHFPMMLFSSV